MAVVSGINGTVTFASGYAYKAKSWSLNATGEDVDITSLGDAWATHLVGLRRWSGSFTCLIDPANTNWPQTTVAGTSDATLGRLQFGDTTAAAVFDYQDGGSVGAFNGNIIILSFDVGAEVEGGGTEITFNFVGDGALGLAAG